ncbi:putative NAD-dependent deacetylase hst4 [Glarea lozoyensis 74030]|uniref:Putative NAD-dependent deacetylase hst4 n=1 Tax=Glarea lozoyensis (strain ATCC 74030 / MF5533) TaxID=1104152 RepID=H0ES74_GLAL7|nr:putative NAD-dependent deacetylase hst4 [Glarea lozoyensis 74030]
MGEEKTTEYLNLPALNESCDEADHKIQDAKLKKLTEVLRSKRKIVVIAGAGMSVSAGIPDFRSSTGLFTTLRGQHKLKSSGKELFDAPRMVLYNEFNPDGDAIGMVSEADLKTKPDAVIVVGTTLKIPGTRRLAREMCQLARDRRGGFTAWINLDQPPSGADLKDCWDMVVTAECDDIARYVGLPHWNDKDCGEYKTIQGPKEEAKGLIGVVVDTKPVDVVNNQVHGIKALYRYQIWRR